MVRGKKNKMQATWGVHMGDAIYEMYNIFILYIQSININLYIYLLQRLYFVMNLKLTER